MSEHTYTRSLVDGRPDLEVRTLSPDVEALLPTHAFKGEAKGAALTLVFDPDLSVAQAASLAVLVATKKGAFNALPAARAARYKEIGERTLELVGGGALVGGDALDLSLESRSALSMYHQLRDNPGMLYPVRFSTFDNGTPISVANAAELNALYLGLMLDLRVHIESGQALKDLIRAAATVAAVNAVKDPR